MIKTAREIFAALYSTDLALQDQAITKYYAATATFNDPLVSVQGLDDIKAQFRALTNFSSIKRDIDSILLSTITNESLKETRDLVVIDAVVTFSLGFVSLPIKSITRLEFNADGLVVAHEDIWSLQHLIANLPIAGSLYQIWRKLTGTASSYAVRSLASGYEYIRNTQTGKKLID